MYVSIQHISFSHFYQKYNAHANRHPNDTDDETIEVQSAPPLKSDGALIEDRSITDHAFSLSSTDI